VKSLTKIQTARIAALLVLAALLGAGVQTVQGSEDKSKFLLHIFGNANLDDTIDEQDIAFVKEVISGAESATNLTDANYDGKIDELDIEQIEAIMRGDEKEISIIDYMNETVTLEEPVTRIVTYDHQGTEILQLLGCQDRVVGVRDTFLAQSSRFPEISKKPSIGNQNDPDAEAVIKANPDLILFAPQGIMDKLPSDIKALNLLDSCESPAFVQESVAIMGYVFNAQDNAEKWQEWHDRYFNEVAKRVATIPENKRVRVFVESSSMNDKQPSSRNALGEGRAASNIVELAGGVNIAKGYFSKKMYGLWGSEGGKIETEWVLSQNPDVIVGALQGNRPYEIKNNSILQAYREQIMSLPGFDHVSAVKNNRVYIITNDGSSSPVYPAAMIALAKWFYPDLFEDMDPLKAQQEYVDMMGLSFNVSKNQNFYYPEF